MWSWKTAAIAVACLACATPSFAQDNPKAEAEAEAEVPGAVDVDGVAEYEDVRQLGELEEQEFQPMVIGAGVFDVGLIAPSVGLATGAKLETKSAKKLRSGKVGADVLNVPAIRARFEATSMFDLVVHDQPSVQSYLDFFDGRGKRILAKWMERMGRYRPLIEQVLDEEGLPKDLIYVAMIESGFSPYATSPAAAAGVWQFIPTTGLDMGLRIDRWVDERRDPVKATRAAARYLKLLHNKFGSWPLALAAYNGGPGLMAKEVSRHNSNNYWRIQRSRGMYDETRRYVPKIIAAGLVAKNADIFGLDHIKEEKAKKWTTVTVSGGTRLSIVADAAGVDYQRIRFLNPALVRKQTPPGEEWDVRIPASKLKHFVKKFDNYVQDRGAEHVRHTVQFGETLAQIGRHHGVTPRILRVANGLERRERVSYGAELLIPKSALGKWKQPKARKQTFVVPNAKLALDGKAKWFYKMNRGDTLAVLSEGLGVNAADIVLWNDLDPKAKLPKGMVVQLFLPTGSPTSTLALLGTDRVTAVAPGSSTAKRIAKKKRAKKKRYHKVKSGESLWLVAKKYRVTVGDLKKWNRKAVGKRGIIQPGMKLTVYPGKK